MLFFSVLLAIVFCSALKQQALICNNCIYLDGGGPKESLAHIQFCFIVWDSELKQQK